MKYKIMDGNEACSTIAYYFTELAGIYPITPASPMAEYTDKWAHSGRVNFQKDPVKVIEMESEAGAIALVHGALQNGVLATTYTASQGLLLMIPNMYKIAGELLPCVINVAARSIATHALSILGDHQDIYATRMTGFAQLASSSVQQVMDLTAVSYLSSLKGRVPFINFFDGFRTSHELQKIEVLDEAKLKNLIDKKALEEFRKHAISNQVVTRGTNQNDDIYFQITEARNKYYLALPDIVDQYMKKITEITGREYHPFNYYGSKNAKKVIVAMGSVCETIKEVIDDVDEDLGLIEVHLYRPFSAKHFLQVLPKTVKKVAVLDRTKESGATGEPLYLDVCNVLSKEKIEVLGGRYGLSSKNTTPYQIKAVYDFLDKKDHFTGFTIGICDDVTNLSLEEVPYERKKKSHEILIYGFGSDGMVSASKDMIKIVGNATNAYTQGYFEYDSKKSGGLTRCHLRFSKDPIRSTYYVENPELVVCTKDTYLRKFSMFDTMGENSTFLLNTSKSREEVIGLLKNKDKKQILQKKIKFYIVNATQLSEEVGLPGKINTIMMTNVFKIAKLIDWKYAISEMKKSLEVIFTNKGKEVIEKNQMAIDRALESLQEIVIDDNLSLSEEEMEEEKNVFDFMIEKRGNELKVSDVERFVDGSFEGGRVKTERKNITEVLPCYNSENCIMCNQCSFVCPHAVIRPFLLNNDEKKQFSEEDQKQFLDANIKDQDLKFSIGVRMENCTGCGLCSKVCPGKKGEKAIVMKNKNDFDYEKELKRSNDLFEKVKEKTPLNIMTIKGSQFVRPKFEFHGACAGCGETPYLKLLTQLFGNELVIANATGCSSIYGGEVPSTAYSVPWANSLFEDNAEFGLGMAMADKFQKEKIKKIIEDHIKDIKQPYQEIFASYYKHMNYEESCLVYEIVETQMKELLPLKEFIKTKSFWMIGGDGWAYDIGYNGLDHVLSTKENVNILVLDTEVYSNTGGQSSKSSKIGSVAKFTMAGKDHAKKDLAKIALTYPHVYVATICLGASMQQAIKALEEAKNYNGPSVIIAYAPCIAQGIKGGMTNSIEEEKKATLSGYFPIFRYHPETKVFSMDSKADFSVYLDFLKGETRYTSLETVNKENYESLLNQNKENAEARYRYYESLKTEKEN